MSAGRTRRCRWPPQAQPRSYSCCCGTTSRCPSSVLRRPRAGRQIPDRTVALRRLCRARFGCRSRPCSGPAAAARGGPRDAGLQFTASVCGTHPGPRADGSAARSALCQRSHRARPRHVCGSHADRHAIRYVAVRLAPNGRAARAAAGLEPAQRRARTRRRNGRSDDSARLSGSSAVPSLLRDKSVPRESHVLVHWVTGN